MTKLACLENNFENVASGDIGGERVVWADRHPPLTIRSAHPNLIVQT